MKISEIIAVAPSVAPEYMFTAIDAKQKQLETAPVVQRLSSMLTIRGAQPLFGLFRGDKLIGWVDLEKVNLHGKDYFAMKMLYVIPEHRKTKAVGAFLIGLQRALNFPVILGSDEFGGVLFRDGAELVQSLHQSARFDVQVLDLKTGETWEFDWSIPNEKHKTLVFETNFPLSYEGFYLFEGSEDDFF